MLARTALLSLNDPPKAAKQRPLGLRGLSLNDPPKAAEFVDPPKAAPKRPPDAETPQRPLGLRGLTWARLLVPLLLPVVAACAASPAPIASPIAPRALPGIELRDLDGTPTRVAAALDGHAGLITLWATWCDACTREIAALARLDARARPRGARVVAVAVGERRETVDAFVRGRGIAWAQLVDPDFRFADAIGQRRVPTTLVVNRSGEVIYEGGALDSAALHALDRVLDPALDPP
ncbi:MAG: TlpA family protein disulfide reductase [Myxococcales bacterium]|nr:TlpA family protein disulfide reductase [Myxococcales bacterium]